MIAAMVREYPADYEVAFWVVVAALAALFVVCALLAWGRPVGRRGGGRRG